MECPPHCQLISAWLWKPRPGAEPWSWQWVGTVCNSFIWSYRHSLGVALKGLIAVGGHTQLLGNNSIRSFQVRKSGLLNYVAWAEDERANRTMFCCMFLTHWGLNLQPESAKLLAFNSTEAEEPNFCLLLHAPSSHWRQWKLCVPNWRQILAWARDVGELAPHAHVRTLSRLAFW